METLKELLDALMLQRICYCKWKGRDCTFWKLDEISFDKGFCVVRKVHEVPPCDQGEWTS